MSEFHFVTGTGVTTSLLASPVADALAGTIYTDIVNMKNYHECYFILSWGVGATGTTTIQVESSDDVDASAVQVINFEYKRISAGETNTAWTAVVAATGILTTAGSHQTYVVRVRKENLNSIDDDQYVRLKCVEGTNNPILGGCLIMMAKPRYDAAQPPLVLT